MKLLKALGLTLTMLLVISQAAAAQKSSTATIYDAVKDFSTQSNPNGVWSYGYLTSWGAPLTLFAWGGTCDISGISWWFTSQCQGYTSVFHNDTTNVVCWATVCEPPDYLGLNPAGYLSVLRWTAPSSGVFLDCCTTSTYLHVLLNSKRSILKAPITSYQWPLAFDPKAFRLSAGDTIDFIVDFGKDGGWGDDSTGVEVKIWSLGQR
jgi:hypothetical protein